MAIRKRHTSKLKATVALEAIRGTKTAAEISSQHGVHPGMVSQWKRSALDAIETAFEGARTSKQESKRDGFSEDQLLSQIGQLKVELDWLKKRL